MFILDMMWGELAKAALQAGEITVWLLPRLFLVVVNIIKPVIIVSGLALLVVATGWKQVAETLREKWVDIGWGKNFINHHNVAFMTGLFRIGAHLAILVGFVLNFVVLVTAFLIILSAVRGDPSLLRDFQLLIGH